MGSLLCRLGSVLAPRAFGERTTCGEFWPPRGISAAGTRLVAASAFRRLLFAIGGFSRLAVSTSIQTLRGNAVQIGGGCVCPSPSPTEKGWPLIGGGGDGQAG
ncbi:hypothetical protein B0T24DRAFT_611952 [Lasiosphaeria ovina]|uniref:Uncharacterized protein n=1 Tax=Lasiosphaeria ovina TaxID=92902 RepID=A0AAE0ND94_9PEZI|nr:hypothetical protein B0T24DRAFT_611952 [Lasiosphaeria ovina]